MRDLRGPFSHLGNLRLQSCCNVCRDSKLDATVLGMFLLPLAKSQHLRCVGGSVLAHKYLLDAFGQTGERFLKYTNDVPTGRYVTIPELAVQNHLLFGPPD